MIDLIKDYERYYDDALKYNPTTRLFIPLAELYKKTGRYHEAIQVLTRGIVNYPSDAVAQTLLAEIYLESKQPASARLAADAALYQDPSNVRSMLIGMRASICLNQTEKAQYYAHMLLKKFPEHEEASGVIRGSLKRSLAVTEKPRCTDMYIDPRGGGDPKQERTKYQLKNARLREKKIDRLKNLLIKVHTHMGKKYEI